MRHGQADPPSPGLPDAERRLTERGRRQAADALQRARLSGLTPALILCSPYPRAAGTAELARKEFGADLETHAAQALTPGSKPEDLWEEIRCWKEHETLLAVGHNPLLSDFLCWLIEAPAGRIHLGTGALAQVALDGLGPRPRGVLIALIRPVED